MNKPDAILIHCSDVSYRTNPDQFASINAYHRDVRQFPVSSLGLFVGYHNLITGDRNYRCRTESDIGAHCNQGIDYTTGRVIAEPNNGTSMNFHSLGICIGFDGDIEFPTPVQVTLLQNQIREWQDKYNIPNDRVFFHRKFATAKTCPGVLITDQWLKTLLERSTAPTIKQNQCLEEKATIEKQNILISSYKALLLELKKLLP